MVRVAWLRADGQSLLHAGTLQSLRAVMLVLLGLASVSCERATSPDASALATLHSVVIGKRLASAEEIQKVQVIRSGKSLTTKLGMSLMQGDMVKTDTNTTAVIAFVGRETEVLISPDTQVTIRDTALHVVIGNLFVKARDFFRVETEYGTAATEGTMFDVDVDDKQVVFAAFEGSVKVEPNATGAQPVLLQPSEESILFKDVATRGPNKRTMSPAKLKRIIERVAKVERLTQGARGVQPIPSFKDLSKEAARLAQVAENEARQDAAEQSVTEIDVSGKGAPPSGDCTPIADGDNVDETIALSEEEDCFVLQGAAGEKVTVFVDNRTKGEMGVMLRKPDGSELATDYDCCGDLELWEQVLPETGTYTVVVDGGGDTTGPYALTLSR